LNWILIIWLGTTSNYTVYQEFKTMEQCMEKQFSVQKALQQAESKMNVTCRKMKPGEPKSNSNITVQRYVFY
jgi:hypothetical protein